MDQRLIRALRARGLNITTAKEESMINRSDREHLEYATNSNRVVFSFNRKDFYNIHIEYTEQGKNHAGIILSKQQNYSVGDQMRRILKLAGSKTAEEMKNQVEFLSAW